VSARSRALLAGGLVVLVVALVMGVFAGSAEQRRLDRARTTESAQEANLRSARAAVTEQHRALKAAYETAGRLAREVTDANNQVTLTQVQLTAAQGSLEKVKTVFTSQSARRAAVQQCLDGVKRALDATRKRDTAAATLYLKSAAPACQVAVTPAGETAPVLAYDFADPYVMRVGGTYYAFATNAAGGSVQQARSNDLVNWSLATNALANLPPWAEAGSVWAPAALDRYPSAVMYYTVREKGTGRQCLSLAVSGSPGGPYLDGSQAPLECGETGAIDPSPFVAANGAPYLLYKTERPARIWSRPLTPDGRAFAGPPSLMLEPAQKWEAGNVEAPSMLRHGNDYWLFFSGNDWNGRNYAEGMARCLGPSGPCSGDPANPVLASSGNTAGPGGGEVFTTPSGEWRIAYHAYQEPLVRYPNSRLLFIAGIGFDGKGRPTITR
jgi:Glycosyl hydrolases family 43